MKIRETIFFLLVNAAIQVGLFALLAAALNRFVVKLRAKQQHVFYVGVFLLCAIAPVANTLWRAQAATTRSVARPASPANGGASRFLWSWERTGNSAPLFAPAARTEDIALLFWSALALYYLARFGGGLIRVSQIRRNALPFACPVDIATALRGCLTPDIALLTSDEIADPMTIGAIHPAILLPAGIVSALNNQELIATFAHECAHIRRRDYLMHTLAELLAVPMAWHPGFRYLRSKISQTRELACDELAAMQFGERRMYARTLVRIASLCLQTSQGYAVGIGMFHADNLEDRIMKLTQPTSPLSRTALAVLTATISLTVCCGVALARGTSLHAPAGAAASAEYAGTWHWMFHGHSFATMILTPSGSGFSGSVTGSHIALDDNGNLSKADPTDDSAPTPIAKTQMEAKGLHVTVIDGAQPFEFIVSLDDKTHAEIRPVGAPPNMKPILAERAN